MNKRLAESEEAALLTVYRLGEGAYGLPVRRLLAASLARQVSVGQAHVTLDRLEAEGLVRSRLAETTPGRGGRRRRHFQVTAAGVDALRAHGHRIP